MKHFFDYKTMSVARKLSISFIAVILLGSILLSLPIFQYANAPKTHYIDHLFTTVSMVCVTGLSVFPISKVYNCWGQIVAILLMQTGGLGLVTLMSLSYYTLRRKMSLNDQTLLQSAITYNSSTDLKKYLYMIFKVTLTLEVLAASILAIDFIPRFGLGHGIFNSIFLAVSAFCNAGFDNLGATSLAQFKLNPLVNIIVCFLIISGGLGFAVWKDLIEATIQTSHKGPKLIKTFPKRLSNHSKLVLKTTTIILLTGTLLSWLLEFGNFRTIANLSLPKQLMVSFFQTVTMRTAGFSTIDYTQTDFATNLVYIIQMLIGGAPGGTAGGFKVTVIAILLLLFKAELSGQSQVTFHYRTIPSSIIKQTLSILTFFFIILISGYLLLLELNPHIDPFSLFFEASSALATVGVTMNTTNQLTLGGRIVIMFLMFIGRVGPITVLLSILQKKEKEIHYAETEIILG
ncbi:TPA: TrkH family potassium uptake protein [Streptococcus agalactiae]